MGPGRLGSAELGWGQLKYSGWGSSAPWVSYSPLEAVCEHGHIFLGEAEAQNDREKHAHPLEP